MADRPYPDLLSDEENKALLETAERLWRDLQTNQLGGYSDGNRPFWIHAEFKAVIEQFGHRDVGQSWTKDQLDAAREKAVDPIAEIRRLCAEGTEGHGDEFYGPILKQLETLTREKASG